MFTDYPEYRYHLLRAANEKFQCAIPALNPDRFAVAQAQAERTWALEMRVLTSAEAHVIEITASQVNEALAQLIARYPNHASFEAALTHNGLDTITIYSALQRELHFDAVLQHIGANYQPVTGAEEETFYDTHQARFVMPERRTARHILITLNDEYEENRRPAVQLRLTTLAAELNGADADTFGRLAYRYSECPSALEGGRLGTLSRHQLYPSLDMALFSLTVGEMSSIVESPLGLHLVFCEQIHPATVSSFEQVRDRIHHFLTNQRRQQLQKAWIATLPH
ncbi:nitrogen fixation protein NifM [Thiospirillum jenense]|uniref:peptidylprolyl isomerase n=1 Tax=Thiospirillum jenense TaxID=1653858 RepID=A0A839HEA7_9GAMM|nr:nitrogen fixation protein NifM [Thiospirillum jenense]MBB1127213.1 nitrogen fixation protein NifM [Thiospirillum jenense]